MRITHWGGHAQRKRVGDADRVIIVDVGWRADSGWYSSKNSELL